MKNVLRLNHDNCTIVMDRTFAKRAENTRSEEYRHLQEVRRDYPTYTVIQRKIKTNPGKESYKGLNYEYMEDYILTHGSAEEIRRNFDKYEELLFIAECHSRSRRYPGIKRWFLETYPEIVGFGKAEEKAKILQIGEKKTA